MVVLSPRHALVAVADVHQVIHYRHIHGSCVAQRLLEGVEKKRHGHCLRRLLRWQRE
jgi:hypothetical protein